MKRRTRISTIFWPFKLPDCARIVTLLSLLLAVLCSQSSLAVLRCDKALGADANVAAQNPSSWLSDSYPSFLSALAAGKRQAKFEDQIGLYSDPRYADMQFYVTNLDALLSKRQLEYGIPEKDIMHLGLAYTSDGNNVLAVKAGDPIPAGYQLRVGVVPTVPFFSQFLAHRIFPMGDPQSMVSFLGFEFPERTARHDAGHVGAIHDFPEYGPMLAKIGDYMVAQAAQHNWAPSKWQEYKKRVAHFSESLWIAELEQQANIRSALGEIGITSNNPMDLKTARRFVLNLSYSDVIRLAQSVVTNMPEIKAVGGAASDYVELDGFRKALGQGNGIHNHFAIDGYQELTDTSIRDSLPFLKLRDALTVHDMRQLRSNLAWVISQASYIQELTLRDWFDGVRMDDSNGGLTKIDAFICTSGLYSIVNRVFRRLCI